MDATPVPQALYVNVNNNPPRVQNGGVRPAQSQPMIAPQQMVTVSGTQISGLQQRQQSLLGTNNLVATPLTMNTTSLPVARPPQIMMNGVRALPAVTLPTVTVQRQAGSPVALAALQIRIGSRPFKPINDIQIKDEGILFTLQNYPNAPVLLNARALIKCRICAAPQLPAIYLQLESSCMKQIKSIFKIQDWEFSDTHQVSLRRYITIFPREIAKADMPHIQSLFRAMVQKFSRTDQILQEITIEQALDIHYEATISMTGVDAARNIAVRANRPSTAARQTAPRGPRPVAPAPPIAPSPTVVPVSNAPLITVPQDPAQWAALQKTLVNGTVYQVKRSPMATIQPCVWDGTTLQPCLVQNTEVQLSCTNIRIGSYKAKATDKVRVKNDATRSGIQFKFKLSSGKEQEVFVQRDEIERCQVCLEGTSIPCMFVYPTAACASRLRNVLDMRSSARDPYYNPAGQEDRHKHMVLFLENVLRTQKDALLQMGVAAPSTAGREPPGKRQQKQLFQEINVLQALQVLSNIKKNSRIQSKITDHFNGNSGGGNSDASRLEQVAKELQEAEEAQGGQEDDDDDDLIMTSEEVGYKCPYTQKTMKEPMRNKHCGHNYEKEAILQFINRKKGVAKCPYAGCGNTIPLTLEDISLNTELQELIRKHHS